MDELDFGALRSLLNQPPSEQVWHQLTRLLYAPDWSERAEQWLPYAQELLDRQWPDALRVMPSAWLSAQDMPPAARLARVIDLAQLNQRVRREVWARIAALDGPVSQLTIRTSLKASQLDALLKMPCFEALRALELYERATLMGRSARVIAERDAASLERLQLPDTIEPDALERLGEVSWPRLRALDLHTSSYGVGWAMSGERLGRLIDQAPLLEELDLSLFPQRALDAVITRPMPALRRIYLDGVMFFDDARVAALERAPWINQLSGLFKQPPTLDCPALRLHQQLITHAKERAHG